MKYRKYSPLSWLCVVSAAVLAPACESSEKDEQEVVVAPLRSPCVGAQPMLCLEYREDGGEAEVMYDSFTGWTHRWGVETRLRYHVEAIEDPPADGSDRRMVVDEIVEERADEVGQEFELSFMETGPDSGWFVAADDRLIMVDTAVACEAALCADVLARTASGAPFSATFDLTGDEDVPLRLLSVRD